MDASARTPSAVTSAVSNLGGGLLSAVSQVGYGVLLLGRALLATRAVFYKSREILRQMFICGIASLPVTMLVALFTGMVLALQVGIELMRYGAKAEINQERLYNGFHLGPGEPVVARAVQAAQQVGLEPVLDKSGGGSDANIFNEHGIPSVIMAAGAGRPHTTEEYLHIPSFMQCLDWLVATLISH